MVTHLQPVREVKENLGRAKAYLNKHEPIKGIASICEAIKIMLQNRVYGSDRIEIEILLSEAIQIINSTPVLFKYLPKNFGYIKGQEKDLYKNLVQIIQKIAENMHKDNAEQQSEEEKEELRKQRLFNKLQSFLNAQDKLKAAGHIKKLVEDFGDQPGIYTEVADNYYKAGYYNEALSYVKKALEKDNKDLRAYQIAVNAFRFLNEYEKAEQFFKKALQAFGEHSNIYMNLSRLYLECSRCAEALEAANKALALDPDNIDIQNLITEINDMDKLETSETKTPT